VANHALTDCCFACYVDGLFFLPQSIRNYLDRSENCKVLRQYGPRRIASVGLLDVDNWQATMVSSSFFRNVCLSDALLRVRSLARMLDFYRGVLGLRVIRADPQRAELSANGDLPVLLVLEEHVAAPARAYGTPGLFHLAFLFPDRVALATATRRLSEHRHPCRGPRITE
jgi:hypothetical protein